MRKFQKSKLIIFILILSVFAILPFIVGIKEIELTPTLLGFFPSDNGNIIDIILYFKTQFFQITTLFLVLFFIGRAIFMDKPEPIPLFKDKRNKKYMIAGFTYILFAILSSILSSNFETALTGVPNSWESIFVLVSYILIFLLSLNYSYEDNLIDLFIRMIPIVFAIIIILGFIEFFFKSPLSLLAPPQTEMTSFFGQTSMTFANPNYASKFLVLFIPIQFYCVKNSVGIKRYINLALLGGMYLLLLFTGSTAAIYICILTTLIILILFFKQIIRNMKYVLPALGLLIIISLTITFVADKEILSTVLPNNNTSFEATAPFDLKSMSIEANVLTIQGEKHDINILLENSSLIFTDENNSKIDSLKKGLTYTFPNKNNISVTTHTAKNVFEVDLGFQRPVPFAIKDNNIYALGPNGTLIKNINQSSGFGFENMQNFATGRGYIWRKALPLIKETIIVGFGADASVFHIPQNDFTGKLLYQGNANLILDKPHNMYLQTILNTGLLSLIALLLIFFFYFKDVIRFSKKTTSLSLLISIGILGYLLCGIFYDSNITVAPLFWALLGMGIATNQKSLNN